MPRLTSLVDFYEMSGLKQYHVTIFYVFFLLISFVSIPGVSAQNLPMGKCVDEFNPETDYFPEKVTIEDATMFSVEYFKNYKLVTNKQTNEAFALYQCGTTIPSDLPKGTKPFPVSVNDVAVTDTSSNAFLDMLGFRSSIKLLGTADLVSSPCIQSSKESGGITILGANETFNTLELEKVDVSFGAAIAEVDLKSVSTSASADPGVLNRVEWIKFYSVFFNAESKANEIYGQIKSNYGCFKNLVNKNPSAEKPTVAWVLYDAPSEFNQNVGTWKIADAVFKKQLTEDAGGIYFNSSTLSFTTASDFLKAIENVDILIDETYIALNSSDVYKNFGLDDQQQQYKFIKNSAIYREDGVTSPNDGRDWFENAIVMGDAVLEDMINVINPSLPKADYRRIWLRNVAKNENITISSASDCTEPDKPLISKADNCSMLPPPSISAKGNGNISSTPNFFSYLTAFVFVNFVMFFF